MDYEKKYNEALGKARAINSGKYVDIPVEDTVLEYVFPELKESEDERIREALVKFHKSTIDVDGIKGEDILAWFEKQGEQKPIIWSEEDEKCIRLSTDIIDSALRAGFCVQLDRDRCVDGLKSLKNELNELSSNYEQRSLLQQSAHGSL